MAVIIAGVVIAVLLFAIIGIILALYCKGYLGTRYKHKRQPSQSHDSHSSRAPIIYHQEQRGSQKSEQKSQLSTNETVYAVPSVTTTSTMTTASTQRQSGRSGKVIYAEVGGDGGRKGPKPRVVKSQYAKVNTDADVTLDKYSVKVHEDGETTSGEEEDPRDHCMV